MELPNRLLRDILFVACIANLVEPFWLIALAVMASGYYYFEVLARRKRSMQMLAFTLLYTFVGLSIVIAKLIDLLPFAVFAIYVAPLYFAGFIFYFIRRVQKLRAAGNAGVQ